MSLQPIRDCLDTFNKHRWQVNDALEKHMRGREKWYRLLSDTAKANPPRMIGIPQEVRRLCDQFERESDKLYPKAMVATRSLPAHLGSDWLRKLRRLKKMHRKLLDSYVTAADDWKPVPFDPNKYCTFISEAYHELEAMEAGDENLTSAATIGPAAPPNGRPSKATINARMIDVMGKKRDALGWTCKQWAQELRCSEAAVVGTSVWKSMKLEREKGKAERAGNKAREKRRQRSGHSD